MSDQEQEVIKKDQDALDDIRENREHIYALRIDVNNVDGRVRNIDEKLNQLLDDRSKAHERIGRWIERFAWAVATAIAASYEAFWRQH